MAFTKSFPHLCFGFQSEIPLGLMSKCSTLHEKLCNWNCGCGEGKHCKWLSVCSFRSLFRPQLFKLVFIIALHWKLTSNDLFICWLHWFVCNSLGHQSSAMGIIEEKVISALCRVGSWGNNLKLFKLIGHFILKFCWLKYHTIYGRD